MTFLELQNRVMTRLNLTSVEARNLTKNYLNERYREVQSSVGTEKTRRGLTTFTTTPNEPLVLVQETSGDPPVSVGVAAVYTVFNPSRHRVLMEVSLEEIRQRDPAQTTVGDPIEYAVYRQENDVVELMLYPVPSSAVTLVADTLKVGTDMTAGTDEPTIPTDYHDILIHGGVADHLKKMEKWRPADEAEKKFEKRLAELRYFLAKSAYLHRHQEDQVVGIHNRRVWPYANLG